VPAHGDAGRKAATDRAHQCLEHPFTVSRREFHSLRQRSLQKPKAKPVVSDIIQFIHVRRAGDHSLNAIDLGEPARIGLNDAPLVTVWVGGAPKSPSYFGPEAREHITRLVQIRIQSRRILSVPQVRHKVAAGVRQETRSLMVKDAKQARQ
jgi:hypothetical protein